MNAKFEIFLQCQFYSSLVIYARCNITILNRSILTFSTKTDYVTFFIHNKILIKKKQDEYWILRKPDLLLTKAKF